LALPVAGMADVVTAVRPASEPTGPAGTALACTDEENPAMAGAVACLEQKGGPLDRTAEQPAHAVRPVPQQDEAESDEGDRLDAQRQGLLQRIKGEKLTIRALTALGEEVARDFQDPADPIHAALEAALAARNKKKRGQLQALANDGAAPRDVKGWAEFLAKCQKELPDSDELVLLAKSKLRARKHSHREPMEGELANPESLTLRKLRQLEHRAIGELGATDAIVGQVRSLIAARVSSHRTPLVARYTKLIKSKLKDVSVQTLNELLQACEEELEADDALLGQARSAIEARVMDKTNPAKAKTIKKKTKKDKEKEKPQKQSGGSRSDVSEEVIINVPRPKSAASAGRSSRSSTKGDSSNGSSLVLAKSALTAVGYEFSGKDDSLSIKLFFLSACLLFGYILLSYMPLILQVAPIGLPGEAEKAAADAAAAAAAASEGG